MKLSDTHYLLLLSIFLYMLSLFLPACYMANGSESYGFLLLIFGWMGVLTGQFAWLANFAAIAAAVLLLCKINNTARLLSIASLILACDTFHFGKGKYGYVTPEHGLEIGGVGLYAWLASLLVLFIASLIARPEKTRVEKQIQTLSKIKSSTSLVRRIAL